MHCFGKESNFADFLRGLSNIILHLLKGGESWLLYEKCKKKGGGGGGGGLAPM